MATIGEFERVEGSFVGVINTLSLRATVRIIPTDERRSDKSPDYRIFAGKGRAPIGVGWKKTSDAGRDFVSVQIDDPSLPAPINAALFATDSPSGGFELIWTRAAS